MQIQIQNLLRSAIIISCVGAIIYIAIHRTAGNASMTYSPIVAYAKKPFSIVRDKTGRFAAYMWAGGRRTRFVIDTGSNTTQLKQIPSTTSLLNKIIGAAYGEGTPINITLSNDAFKFPVIALKNPHFQANIIGWDTLGNFASLLFTKDALYVNYDTSGIKGCLKSPLITGGHAGQSITLSLELNGRVRRVEFDSGSKFQLVGDATGDFKSNRYTRIDFAHSSRTVQFKLRSVQLAASGPKAGTAEYLTLVESIWNKRDVPKYARTHHLVIGLPILNFFDIYVNNVAHRACLLDRADLTPLAPPDSPDAARWTVPRTRSAATVVCGGSAQPPGSEPKLCADNTYDG